MIAGRSGGNVKRSGITGQRLAAIFFMGCVLLNYPILSLFTRRVAIAGIPLLYAYLFGVWALLIALIRVVLERPKE